MTNNNHRPRNFISNVTSWLQVQFEIPQIFFKVICVPMLFNVKKPPCGYIYIYIYPYWDVNFYKLFLNPSSQILKTSQYLVLLPLWPCLLILGIGFNCTCCELRSIIQKIILYINLQYLHLHLHLHEWWREKYLRAKAAKRHIINSSSDVGASMVAGKRWDEIVLPLHVTFTCYNLYVNCYMMDTYYYNILYDKAKKREMRVWLL